MSKRPRLIDYVGDQEQAINGVVAADRDRTYSRLNMLLDTYRSDSPGMWSQNVIELSRHFTSTAYVAINTLSTQAAAAEVTVSERSPYIDMGDIPLPYNTDVMQFIEEPNDHESFSDILYQISLQLSLTGVALVWMPYANTSQDEFMRPSELYVIPTATAMPYPRTPLYPDGSYLVLPYYPQGWYSQVMPGFQGSFGEHVPAGQIIKIKKDHPFLKYDGYAVLTALQRQIDTIDAIDMARWNTQMNGTDPTLLATFEEAKFDPSQEDLEALAERIRAIHAGPLAKKIMMMPPGIQAQPVSHTPKDMAWIEGWNQLNQFCMCAYGVPRTVAGLHDAQTDKQIFAAWKQFYVMSLNPHLKKIYDAFNRRLIRPFFGRDLYMKIKGAHIQDEDLLERQLALDMKVEGARTVNEYRKARGLPPVPPPLGDMWISRTNTLVYEGVHGSGGKPNPGEQNKKKKQKAFDPELLATAFERHKTSGVLPHEIKIG